MRFIWVILVFLLLSISSLTTAQSKHFVLFPPDPPAKEIIIEKDKIFIPDSDVYKANKDFTFDWTNHETILPNKNKITDIETVLKKMDGFNRLSQKDRQASSELLYKLGAYYLHVNNDPDSAILRLTQASPLSSDKQLKIWNKDQLAYAYQLKFAKSQQSADKDKATAYTKEVIATFKNPKNKQVAFALCINGLMQNNSKDYKQAEQTLKKAIVLYESLPNGKDDTYQRARNKLAVVILHQNGRDSEALSILNDIQKFWQKKAKYEENPYAARNLLALGETNLKMANPAIARDDFNNAITIYGKVYGYTSDKLKDPYKLLATAYQKLGNQQVEACIFKADGLDKTGISAQL